MKLIELISGVRTCTPKDKRLNIRTSQEFLGLVEYLVDARKLSGASELIEKCVLYYAEQLEKHQPFVPMRFDELGFASEHDLNIAHTRVHAQRVS